MRRGLFLLLLLAGASVARTAVAAEDPIALPPSPELLEVHFPRGILVPFETTYEIFRDGTEFFVYRTFADAPKLVCTVYWGRLTPEALSRLNGSLVAGRVGLQSGQCGAPASSRGPGYIGVRWFGQNGRSSSFEFGTGTQEGCPDGILKIIAALPLFSVAEARPLTDCPLASE